MRVAILLTLSCTVVSFPDGSYSELSPRPEVVLERNKPELDESYSYALLASLIPIEARVGAGDGDAVKSESEALEWSKALAELDSYSYEHEQEALEWDETVAYLVRVDELRWAELLHTDGSLAADPMPTYLLNYQTGRILDTSLLDLLQEFASIQQMACMLTMLHVGMVVTVLLLCCRASSPTAPDMAAQYGQAPKV